MPTQFSFEDAVAPTGFSFEEANKPVSFSLDEAQTPELPTPPTDAGPNWKPDTNSIYEKDTWLDKPIFKLGDAMFDTSDPVAQPKMGRIAGAIPDKLSPTQEGISESLKGAVNSLTTPRNIAYMLGSMGVASTGTAGKILVSSLWTAVMGKNAVEDAPQIYSALGEEMAKPEAERDQKKIASLLTQGGLDVAMAVAPAIHSVGEMGLGDRPLTSEQDLSQLKQQAAQELPQPEVPNASSQQQATEVHGDLQPFSYEVAREMPAAESSAGVQPQAERGIPEQPQPDTTQKEVVLAKPVEQAPADMAGPGSPARTEMEENPGNPDVYGIAERVRAERAQAGQVAPVEPGEGIAAADSVEHGRKLIESGANPEVSMTNFEATGKLGHDDIAMARAEGERLAQAARMTEEKFGTDSDEYRAAWKALSDWDQRSKPMQTEWHKIGQAQQGETDIDTGSFTGLQREYKAQTGKDFDPRQTVDATKKARAVTDANGAVETVAEELTKHIVQKTDSLSAAEKAALDAAHKTVRENAVRIADLENKARLAEAQRAQDIADIEKKAMDAALQAASKTVRENAIRIAGEENKSRLSEVQRKQELSDIQKQAADRARSAADKTVRENAARIAKKEIADRNQRAALEKKQIESERHAAQKKVDEANRDIRNAAVKAARDSNKERVAKADLPTYVWTKAREYINDGMSNFDDIRHKLATDLGLPVNKVSEAMGKDKRAKFLQDDLWRKQQTARQLHEQAKRWLIGQQIPEYQKYLATVPKAMFTAKVVGHGTVALGTHAPMLAFQPNYWKVYAQNYGRMYKMVGAPTRKGQAAGKAFHENQVQDLLRRPNYTTARRAGLVNDPYVYEDYNSPDVMSGMGRLTQMGNRGYSVLKMLRQDMFDQQWNRLSKTQQIADVAKGISKGINHATGVTEIAAPKGASVALFAPRLEASRVAWLAVDPVKAAMTLLEADGNNEAGRPTWEGISDGDRTFAINQLKEKAWVAGTYFSLLALNQGFLSAMDSKQKINLDDPMKSDFLKFKAAGMVGSYGNAMLSMARLPARLFIGIANEGKLNKIVYEDENVASILFDFVRSQMSPFMGTVTDLGIGRDFERRPLPRAGFGLLPGKTNMPKRLEAQGKLPYSWTEYATQQALPIPAQEAVKEVWKYQGMTEPQINDYLKSLAIFSIMLGTGGRLTKDYDLPNH